MGAPRASRRLIGRYAVYGEIATGGMATVHFGRLLGPVGFARTVAVKRLHPHVAKDPDFVSMFYDEARLASRVQHPNVVATLDVVTHEGELYLVMEYVAGEPLSRLLRAAKKAEEPCVPLPIAAAIVSGTLHGLHAAHEARDERGHPLGIVHRDVSPQNVLVGTDGVPRVLDFGVAKAAGRVHTTREGTLKGKLPYMAPEQVRGAAVDRRTDVYAAGIVLWEMLTGRLLFGNEDNDAAVLASVLERRVPRPSELAPDVPPAVDDVVLRALARDPSRRFPTAQHMVIALEAAAGPIAGALQVGAWVEQIAGDLMANRATALREIEEDAGPPEALDPAGLVTRLGSLPDTTAVPSVAAVEAPPPRRVRPLVVTSAAVGAALTLALLVVPHRAQKSPPSTLPASAGEPPTTGAPSAVTAASASLPAPSTSDSAAAPPDAGALEIGDLDQPPRDRVPRRRSPKELSDTGPRNGARALPPGCDPPYTDDATGRHYKRQCLK